MYQYNTIESENQHGNTYKLSWLVIKGKNVMPSFIVEDEEGEEIFPADNEVWLKKEFYKELIYAIATKNYQGIIELAEGQICIEDLEEIKEMFDSAINQNVI